MILNNPIVESDGIPVPLGGRNSPLPKYQVETCPMIGALLCPADEVYRHCCAIAVEESPNSVGGRATAITPSNARATLLDLDGSPIELVI